MAYCVGADQDVHGEDGEGLEASSGGVEEEKDEGVVVEDVTEEVKARPKHMGLGAYEVDEIDKALSEFRSSTKEGLECDVASVTAVMDRMDGPCRRLVHIGESLEFVRECLGTLTTCLDVRNVPGMKLVEPEGIKMARAKLLCHEGTVAYVMTRKKCESRGLHEWDEAFRDDVHAGLTLSLQKHRSAAAGLRALGKKRRSPPGPRLARVL